MKIYWTDTAEGHLDAIYKYIAQDSPEYALRVVDKILADLNNFLIFLSLAAESLNIILTTYVK